MTAPAASPDTTQPLADPPQQEPSDQQTDEQSTDDQQKPSPNSEAARWRVRVREVEAERDALAEQVTGYRRRDCEAVVADLLAEPADLWDIGRADLADCLNEDGTPNEDAARAAATALIESRPGLAKNPGATGPKQWGQSNTRRPSSSRGGWADVINRR